VRSLDDFAPEAPHIIRLDGTGEALTEFETEAALTATAAAAQVPRRPGRQFRAWPARSSWIAAISAVLVLTTLAARRPVVRSESALAVPPATTSAPAPTATRAAAASPHAPPILSGSWRLTSRVADTDVRRYRGLVLGYLLTLEQDGARLRGEGVKWTENGRPLSRSAQTPIMLEGTIGDDGALQLAFTESGLRRTSRGAFTLRLVEDGSLSGRFRSDAARSSGSVTVMRAE
jgi:hypothetical protein